MNFRKKAALKIGTLLITGMALSSSVMAQDEGDLSLPDTGVDLVALIVLSIAFMGGIVAAAVAGFAVFAAIKKGLVWMRKAFG